MRVLDYAPELCINDPDGKHHWVFDGIWQDSFEKVVIGNLCKNCDIQQSTIGDHVSYSERSLTFEI